MNLTRDSATCKIKKIYVAECPVCKKRVDLNLSSSKWRPKWWKLKNTKVWCMHYQRYEF